MLILMLLFILILCVLMGGANKSMHQNSETSDVVAVIADSDYEKYWNDMEQFETRCENYADAADDNTEGYVDFDVAVYIDTRCSDGVANKSMHKNSETTDVVTVRADSDYEKYWNDIEQSETRCESYADVVDDNMEGHVDFDVDFAVDTDTRYSDSSANKFKLQNSETTDVVAVTVDSDYEKYWNDIEQIETRCENYADVSNDNKSRDVLNSHYMMLLDNLKEDKKLYMLESALGMGTSVAVKYKKKNGSNDAFDLESLETRKCRWKQDCLRTENVLKCYSGKEKIDSLRTSRSYAFGTGSSVTVMCSKNDGSSYGFSLENLHTRKYYQKLEERRAENVLKCHSVKEIDSPKTFRSHLGREKTKNQKRVRRGIVNREKCKNSRWFSRSNLWRKKLDNPINVLSTSKRRETEIPRETLNKSKRKDNETPSMHDVVKRAKTESLKNLRSTRRETNDKSSNLHDVEKREKAERANMLRNVLRRESIENSSRKTEISMKTLDRSKKTNNEILIMHVVKREETENLITWRSNSTTETNDSSSSLHDAMKREVADSARNLRNVLRRESMGNSRRQKTEIPRKGLSKWRRKDNESPCVIHDVVKRQKNESQRTFKRNSRSGNNESLNVLHDVVKGERVESARNLSIVFRRESMENSSKRKTQIPRKPLSILKREDNDSPCIMHDVVQSEKDESQRTFKSNLRSGNNESLNVLHDVVKREKAENARTLRNLFCRNSMGTRKKLRKQTVEKNVEKEVEDPIFFTDDGCSTKATTNSPKYNSVSPPERDKEAAYDENESDSEVVIMDVDPFSGGNYTPFVDEDGERCLEIFTGLNASEYREKLMEVLQRPYDRMECQKLLLDASYRGALELFSNGKSYLDEYSDLAVLIDEAKRDKRRILNLLRGFFFWLQNLMHEGQFQPWLDPSCLSILPPD